MLDDVLRCKGRRSWRIEEFDYSSLQAAAAVPKRIIRFTEIFAALIEDTELLRWLARPSCAWLHKEHTCDKLATSLSRNIL